MHMSKSHKDDFLISRSVFNFPEFSLSGICGSHFPGFSLISRVPRNPVRLLKFAGKAETKLVKQNKKNSMSKAKG